MSELIPNLDTYHPAVRAQVNEALAGLLENTHENRERLRHFPIVRGLMADAWDAAVYDTGAWKRLAEIPPNPYRTEPDDERH